MVGGAFVKVPLMPCAMDVAFSTLSSPALFSWWVSCRSKEPFDVHILRLGIDGNEIALYTGETFSSMPEPSIDG